MGKEMTPLEALDELHCVAYGMKKYDEKTIKAEKIVESALKRQDSIEITAIDIEQDNKELCKENKKLKRVLEIIKEKKVDTDSLFAIWAIKNIDTEYCLKLYNNQRTIYEKPKLTEEEFNLLKEILTQC